MFDLLEGLWVLTKFSLSEFPDKLKVLHEGMEQEYIKAKFYQTRGAGARAIKNMLGTEFSGVSERRILKILEKEPLHQLLRMKSRPNSSAGSLQNSSLTSSLPTKKDTRTDFIPQITNRVEMATQSELEKMSQMDARYNPPKDGNCMFFAFLDQINTYLPINEIARTAHELRRAAVDYLRTNFYLGGQNNAPWCNAVPERSLPNYLDHMRQDGTHGDRVILQALSELFNVQVVITSTSNQGMTLITPAGSNTFRPDAPYIVLGHLIENHMDHYLSMDHNNDIMRDLEAMKLIGKKPNDFRGDKPKAMEIKISPTAIKVESWSMV